MAGRQIRRLVIFSEDEVQGVMDTDVPVHREIGDARYVLRSDKWFGRLTRVTVKRIMGMAREGEGRHGNGA